jgi:hypothetical protein
MAERDLPWHALLAPLPASAVPVRGPVASPQILERPEGESLRGWQQLVIDLSAGTQGLRNVLVVLDEQGRLLSASDTVLHCRVRPGAPPAEAIEHVHESLGGRFELDGTFRGTRWRSVSVGEEGSDEMRSEGPVKSVPSEADVAALRELVAAVMAR